MILRISRSACMVRAEEPDSTNCTIIMVLLPSAE